MNYDTMDIGYTSIILDLDILVNLDIDILKNNLRQKHNNSIFLSPGITYTKNESYIQIDSISNIQNAYKALILIAPDTIDTLIDDTMEIDDMDNVNKYIYSSDLFNHTIGHCYIIWDKDRDICGIWEVCLHNNTSIESGNYFIETLLDSLAVNIPSTTSLWIGVSLNNNIFWDIISLYTTFGFKEPFMFKNDPFTKNDWNTMGGIVQFIRKNQYIDTKNIQSEKVKTEVFYIITENRNIRSLTTKNCSINLRFNTSFAKWLSKVPFGNLTLNHDKTLSQKELGGVLIIDNIYINNQQKFIGELVLNTKYNTIIGTERQVNIIEGRYTFHSHPVNSIDTNLALATPSAKDFAGFLFLALSKNAIFHSVITEEGIYIISLHPKWITEEIIKQLKSNPPYKIVQENMEWNNIGFIQNKNKLPKELIPDYLEKIQKQQLQIFLGKEIFYVQFLDWQSVLTGKDTTIWYPTINDECFITEKNITVFNKFFPSQKIPI